MGKKKIFMLSFILFLVLGVSKVNAQNELLETDPQCRGFNLRYQTNDGNGVKQVFVGLNNTSLKIETPVRSGYKFAGWYYDYNLTIPVNETKAINLSNSYKIRANASCPTVNIYAKWEQTQSSTINYQNCNKGFKLVYYYNNGKNPEEVFVRNDGIFGLTIPERSGYKFAGWYYDTNFTVPVTVQYEKDLSDWYKVGTSNGCQLVRIYAKWEQEKPAVMSEESCGGYSLRYQTNDGNGVKQVFVGLNNTYASLETPTRTGYKFLGWYYDYSLTIPVSDTRLSKLSNSYKIYSNASCPALNVYAKWEKVNTPTPTKTTTKVTTKPAITPSVISEQTCGGFNLRYQSNDGNGVKEVFVISSNNKLGLETPVRSGYKFLGWYYDYNLTIPVNETKAVNLSNSYKVYSNSSCPALNVYAKWEKINNTPVPTQSITPTVQPTTKPVVIPSPVPEQTCGGFNLRYQTNDGNGVKEVFVASNNSDLNIEIPVRNDYTFLGWYYDPNFTVPVTESKASKLSSSYKVYANASCPALNIYAKWGKKFNNNDATISVPEDISGNINNIEIIKYERESELRRFKEIKTLSNVKFEAYEIDLYDISNNKIQPDGMVKIELEIPKSLNKDRLIVYRLEDDKLISYNVKIIDKKLVFETDHFSTYIVAEKPVNVGSGILSNIGMLLLIAVVIGVTYHFTNKLVKRY